MEQSATATSSNLSPPPLKAAPALLVGSQARSCGGGGGVAPRISPFHSFSATHLLPSESVYESAAKLLFMSIKWARSVPSFLQLPEGDQTLLLEDAWAQLFIIGLAQWAVHFDEGSLLRESLSPRDEYPKLSADAKHLKDAKTCQ